MPKNKKLRCIAIGDLHGKEVWKNIDPSKYDRIIFLGDYVDAFVCPDVIMLKNLREIVEFKKANPEKVILLLGNHDLQYLEWPEPKFGCTGFRPQMQPQFSGIFKENRQLFQVAYQIGEYLFTHAGLTRRFYEKNKGLLDYYCLEECNYADKLNAVQNHGTMKEKTMLHNVGSDRGGKGFGGITWVDKNEFSVENLLPGIHQIVGHTPVWPSKGIADFKDNASIQFFDVLDVAPDFFWSGEISDGLC